CLIQVNLFLKAGLVFGLAFSALAAHGFNHFRRFGHFVPFQLHAEVVVTTSSDLLGVDGVGKVYEASLIHYGFLPKAMSVCAYLHWASRHETMFNYIVDAAERRVPGGSWSLNGTNMDHGCFV